MTYEKAPCRPSDPVTLHVEQYKIPKNIRKTICSAVIHRRHIITVGTTVVRALESAARTNGNLMRLHGTTRLFIRPGYRFKIVRGIITNFHVPRSSLMMLVAAFTGRNRLITLYNLAREKRFRFFSFGDGMLIT